MIRFIINIDDTWTRTIRCPRGDWELPARPLEPCPVPHWSGEASATKQEPWYQEQSLSELRKVSEKLVTIPVDDAGPLAPRLARFLFCALIGDRDWQEMKAHADAVADNPQEEIEIALSLQVLTDDQPAGELGLLHGLPWELICSVTEAGKRLVTVTRLVTSGGGVPAPLSWPPKILFVLSVSLMDEQLRPAKEAMGLLSHFELGDAMDITRTLRPDLCSRVLECATMEKLKTTVQSFRPEIVYFICHGRAGQLILEKDDEYRTSQGADLLRCLVQEDHTPSLLILAACESASMAGPHVSGSLAAQLVAGGIPIVIGMAGKISSVGCRLFTRALADSLFHNPEKSLREALCLARAAARSMQASDEPAEWALPTTYMADNEQTARFCPVSAEAVDRRQRWESRARKLKLIDKYNPVFCCRERLAWTYDQVIHGSDITVVLARAAGPSMGKSRALREVGVWALRDGHLPFPVLPSKDRLPSTERELGLELLQAMWLVQHAFQLKSDGVFVGKLLRILAEGIEPLAPDEQWMDPYDYTAKVRAIRARAAATPQPDLSLIRAAFGHDAGEIKEMILKEHADDFLGEATRAVLLLDDADKYLPLLQELFLDDAVATLGFGGFGPGSKISVFAAVETSDHDLKELEQARWVEVVELTPFPKGIVGELAYERILLHPYDNAISEVPLCFKPGQTEEDLKNWRRSIHTYVMGIPGELVGENGRMCSAVEIVRNIHQVVVPADDASRVREFVKEWKAS